METDLEESKGNRTLLRAPPIAVILNLVALLPVVLLLSGFTRAQIISLSYGISASEYFTVSDYINLGATGSALYSCTVAFLMLLTLLPFFRSYPSEESKPNLGKDLLVSVALSGAAAIFFLRIFLAQVAIPRLRNH